MDTPQLLLDMYVTSNFALKSKKQFFDEHGHFAVFVAFWVIAFVFFQDSEKREMLLQTFTFFLRRLLKKLTHFEVTFR